MRWWKTALLVGFLAGPGYAQAAPPVITNPEWVRRPNGDEYARAYPPWAAMMRLDGQATLRCGVNELGRLTDCKAIAESPAGLGFGKAAISIAGTFLMRPQTRDGVPVPGGTVQIPLHFVMPAPPPPPPTPTPRSKRALTLAQRLVAIQVAEDESTSSYTSMARRLEDAPQKDISDAARLAIAKAIRAAAPPRLAEFHEARARLFANAFSESELSALVAFFSSEPGKALWRRDDALVAEQGRIARESARLVVKQAKEIFCTDHHCPAKPDYEATLAASNSSLTPVDVQAPRWAQEPSFYETYTARPPLSKMLRLNGWARLVCKVGQQGVPEDCAVSAEGPTGVGFGSVARTLVTSYRLEPGQLADGAVGKSTSMVVMFFDPVNYEVDKPPSPPVAARSPESLALARELLLARDKPVLSAVSLAAQKNTWTSEAANNVSKAEWDEAIDILVQGRSAAWDNYVTLESHFESTRFSDAELRAGITFWRSPAGKAWLAKTDGLGPQLYALSRFHEDRVWRDVDRLFCAEHDCRPVAQDTPGQPAASTTPAASTAKP